MKHGEAQRREREVQRAAAVRAGATRNAGTPRGRSVTAGDVSAYALSGHARCRGKGTVGLVGGRAVPCTCATKRFLRKHPEVIVDGETGEAWWPAKLGGEEEAG